MADETNGFKTPDPPCNGRFASTRWSIVLTAAGGESTASDEALAHLCETYWPPLYAFARRSGHCADEAQDLTQGFFARLLEKRDIGAARPELGRFRSFLLGAFKHYIANVRKHASAKKRGGGETPFPLDFRPAEELFVREPAETRTPETQYERQWVLTLLESVLGELRTDYTRRGQGDLFERLKPFLTDEHPATSYHSLSAECGISEGMLRVAVHRLRRRYRDLLRRTVADTVSSPSDIEDEIRFLFSALAG